MLHVPNICRNATLSALSGTLIIAKVIVSSFSPPAGMRMPLESFLSALQLCALSLLCLVLL